MTTNLKAQRLDRQRTLAQIAAQITALRDRDEVLQSVVEAARRLLESDGAHLTLMAPDGLSLQPVVVAGGVDEDTLGWLAGERFPIPDGMNGLAAARGEPVWTDDYAADPRIPHAAEDAAVAERLGLHSMAVVPMRAELEIIGTLAVSHRERHVFGADEIELLGLLADHGAIAIVNARLYGELRESERRYRFLVDNSPDIVWSVDADGRFTFFSEALEPRTGWKPAQLLGQHFGFLTDAATAPIARAGWQAMRANPGREQRIRMELPLASGERSTVEITMIGTVVDGRFAGAHGSLRDIGERERLEADLRRQAADLAAAQERASLARELHDSVTQALFSIGLTARSLELLLDADPAAARAKLGELRELQRDALAEMRALIFELRPASLEQDGLVQALRNHVTAVHGRTGIAITFDAESSERLPLEVEDALYRIAQEALHNMVKHAKARLASVELERLEGSVRLRIEDDGRGFDPARVSGRHLGLAGMRQRAERIGAMLAVTSQPGAGTRIVVEVSLPPEGRLAE